MCTPRQTLDVDCGSISWRPPRHPASRESTAMLMGLLHRLAALPWVYDGIQVLSGGSRLRNDLARRLPRLPSASIVLDVGGGTGAYRCLWPRATYVCLDAEWPKLRGFRAKSPRGRALLADATRLPIRTASVDAVLCIRMSHHVPRERLTHLIHESRRVLAGGGTLVFADAVWDPKRSVARLLWKYDRGAYPHTTAELRGLLSTHFEPLHDEQQTYWVDHLVWLGRPKPTLAPATGTPGKSASSSAHGGIGP